MKKLALKLKPYVWISLACVVAFCICLGLFINVLSAVGSLNAAKVWAGDSDMRFAQLAVFFPESDKLEEGDLASYFKTVDEKLAEASVEEEEGHTLYNYAVSGSGKVTVNGEKGNQSVTAIGVGGDFFLFHPMTLRSGSYISKDDFMDDRVVLDRELAWSLFGGINVEGMEVIIDNERFIVAGVVEREDDYATKKAYTDGPGLFMSYSALNRLTEEKISCLEVVMPDVISGFALKVTEDAFTGRNAEVIENSKRYSVSQIMHITGSFSERTVQHNGIVYPYWENAVRITESNLSVLFVLMIIFGAFPLVTLIVVITRFVSAKIKYLKETVPKKIEERIEEKKEENYRKTGGQ